MQRNIKRTVFHPKSLAAPKHQARVNNRGDSTKEMPEYLKLYKQDVKQLAN